jgi:hypothetical protein
MITDLMLEVIQNFSSVFSFHIFSPLFGRPQPDALFSPLICRGQIKK